MKCHPHAEVHVDFLVHSSSFHMYATMHVTIIHTIRASSPTSPIVAIAIKEFDAVTVMLSPIEEVPIAIATKEFGM